MLSHNSKQTTPKHCSAGPRKPAQHQVDARQLAATFSSLQAAVGAHMKRHPPTDAPPVPVPPDTAPITTLPDTPADGVVPVRLLAMLHGMSGSTGMAASFGCFAHLLQIHRKLQHNPTTPTPAPTPIPKSAAADRSGQSLPAELGEGASGNVLQHAGHAHAGDNADKDAHMGMTDDGDDVDDDVELSPCPGVLQDVPGQVQRLTNVLKLPWRLQAAGTEPPPGR